MWDAFIHRCPHLNDENDESNYLFYHEIYEKCSAKHIAHIG